MRPLRVVHLITDLDIGGAELMLSRLVDSFDGSVESIVVSLIDRGELADVLAAKGIRVMTLGMRASSLDVTGLYRAVRLFQRLKPDVLQTWLYHADLVGLLAGMTARVPVIVWNIRCATLERADHSASLLWLRKLLSLISHWPAAIVCNSTAGVRAHQEVGYHPRRWIVIPNGFDTDRYRPDPIARAGFRRELGVRAEVPLVGLVARFHPMKDHSTFLQAAALIASRDENARFVLAGRGVPESRMVGELIARLGIGPRVHLLPDRRDPARVLAALDVAVLSSYSEAFPNVIGEAMACGTPPVATAVGDSTILVGDAGRLVPPRDPAALADGVMEILAMSADERRALGLAARARIVDRFALRDVTRTYQHLYEELWGSVAAEPSTV